jgi:hypothetical protein
MKLTFSLTDNYGNTTKVEKEFDSEGVIEDIIEQIEECLLACGYHPSSVKDALGEGFFEE